MFSPKSALITVALWCASSMLMAQEGDLAYVPESAPERTADDVTIGMRDTEEPGVVHIDLPKGSYQLDLLNASGNLVKEQVVEGGAQLDLRELRPGTWTIRAHSPKGRHVRRFVVLGGGNIWIDARPARRR